MTKITVFALIVLCLVCLVLFAATTMTNGGVVYKTFATHPDTPPSGGLLVWAKTDGTMQTTNSSGTDSGMGGSGGGGGLILSSNRQPVVNLTGTTAVLFTATVPSIAPGGCIEMRFSFTAGGTTDNSYSITYGSVTATIWASVSYVGPWLIEHLTICNNAGVQNAQQITFPPLWIASTSTFYWPNLDPANYITTGTVNSSVPQSLQLNAYGPTGGTVQLNSAQVWTK